MTQDARSAFIRNLKKEKSSISASAKQTHTTGSFLDDEEIIERLGLTEDNQQFPAKLSRIRYGVDKNKENYFAFNFVITEGEHLGIAISQFCGLGGKNKEDKEKRANRLMRYFQSLNVNTDQWKCTPDELLEKLVDAADELTQTKPALVLALNVWGDDNDRLGITIAALLDGPASNPSSSGTKAKPKSSTKPSSTSSDGPTVEDMESWAKAADEKGSASCKKLEDIGKPLNLDADEYESWTDYLTAIIESPIEPTEDDETEEEYEDADDESSEVDFEAYVGFECEMDADGDALNVTTKSYDSDSETFVVEDEDGSEYETTWDKLDFGYGYGTPEPEED